ncbi:MAG TPA: oligosaccharide flippase family protein, partial [Gaiellaceae bacterium]|nr:oligosaccharide flippase family protein [Gaiellaceae bacterium]
MSLAFQMRRLGRHSAIYGVGGLVSRVLATLLLPLYTSYLTQKEFGEVELVTSATAVAAIVLQMGIASAFFRFYFDAKEEASKLTVIRTSFWFTMGTATLGLLIGV